MISTTKKYHGHGKEVDDSNNVFCVGTHYYFQYLQIDKRSKNALARVFTAPTSLSTVPTYNNFETSIVISSNLLSYY